MKHQIRSMDPKRVVDALGALAHEHRLAAYRLLVEAGPEGLPAGFVADRLRLPPSSLTFHLQQLLRAGLITQRRRSRQMIYAAEFGQMNRLLSYLSENCCGRDAAGSVSLCNPARPTPSASARAGKKSA